MRSRAIGGKRTANRRSLSRRDFLKLGALGIGGTAMLGSAACGGSSSGAPEGSIEVWIMQPGSPDLEELIRGFAREFGEANPGSAVTVQFVPWDSAHDRFVTAIGGGQVPDLAEMGTTWTPEFGALGAFSAVEGQLGGGEYVSSLVESGTVDGESYGLPWYGGVRSLIYRSDVLEDLGVEVPGNWDQLVEVGEAVKSDTRLYPFGVAGDYLHVYLPMVWQAGGQIAERSGDSWTSRMDSPEAVEAFEFYAGLFRDRQFAPEGALTWTEVDVRTAFENGDFAMMVGGMWELPAILSNAPDLEGKVRTALLPEGPGGNRDAFAGGSHLVVFEESENAETAQAFAQFMVTPEKISRFSEEIGYLPGTLEGARATSYSKDPLYSPFVDQLLENSRTYPPTPAWGGFEGEGIFVTAMQQIMRGDRGAEDALAEVAAAMNEGFRDQ